MGLTAGEIKAMLGLERHPTCGFVAETYRSSLRIPTWALPDPYESGRPYASALYFLVTPDAQIVMHRIRADQLYHHYLGDPLEVLLLYPNGDGAVVTVGSDLASGMRPQLLIPGGTFHTSRLAARGQLRPARQHGVARRRTTRRRAWKHRRLGESLPRFPRGDLRIRRCEQRLCLIVW